VNCARFDLWLDQGRAPIAEAAMLRHAGECARCARALQASLAMDEALEHEPARVPAPATDFTDRVMARLGPRPLAAPPVPLPPLWLRVAGDRAVIAAAAFAAGVLIGRDPLTRWLSAFTARASTDVHAAGEIVTATLRSHGTLGSIVTGPGLEWVWSSLAVTAGLGLAWLAFDRFDAGGTRARGR
jgi:hypothetical protein